MIKAIRSPLFYVGDKYKLMPQLTQLFPNDINKYYDVFCGGGSASINVDAKSYVMNDIDNRIIELHRNIQNNCEDIEGYINKMYNIIESYGLSLSEKVINPDIEKLKKKYIKTYYAKYNKTAYLKLRRDYNKGFNIDFLYLLLIYGFNHMIRFNNDGMFNLPVGNIDWNKNVSSALRDYAEWYNKNHIILSSGDDFEIFVRKQSLQEDDFLYFDPPYLITSSDYNKLWSEKEELRLYKLLDDLHAQGIKWGLSNMTEHKGKVNSLLLNWANNYKIYNIKSNYISRFDNTSKKFSKEIYVTNL